MRSPPSTQPAANVRTNPAAILSLFAVFACGRVVVAQQADAAQVERAIAAFEQSASKDMKERTAALSALAAIDDPRATEALCAALKQKGKDPFAARIADAIGQKQRPQAIPTLEGLVKAKDTEPQLRNSAARALGKQGNRGIDTLIDVAPVPSIRSTAIRLR